MAPFSKTSIEVLGNESQFGAHAEIKDSREVCVKIAACHEQDKGIQILLRETTAMALSGPPGISDLLEQGHAPHLLLRYSPACWNAINPGAGNSL